jgi:hypothetical protein
MCTFIAEKTIFTIESIINKEKDEKDMIYTIISVCVACGIYIFFITDLAESNKQ